MPRIQPISAPASPRLASGTKPAAGFGDTPGLSSATPIVRRDPAAPAVDVSDLVSRREALAGQWDGYWRYTGYRVDGARSVASPASPGANVQFTVTSDPAVIAALDMQVPDTDRVVYSDGAHGYIIDRLIGDSIERATAMAPAIDWDIPADSSLPVRVREIQRRFSILRGIDDLTKRIAAASPPVVVVAPPAPTLRIVGMPDHGTVEIDGVRTKDDSSRWADALLSAWIVPAASGAHTVRVIPPTGGGAARTARVTIPETGEASVTFSTMTPEADAAPPVVTPHETVPAVTTGTVVLRAGDDPEISGQAGESLTSAVLRAGPGQTAIPLDGSGNTWRATVPAGRYTLEAILQRWATGDMVTGTQRPAVQYAADVNVVAGQTVTVNRSDLHETGQTVPHGDATPPTVTTPGATGSVIVRSSAPNAAAMIQRVEGSQGELGHGLSMVEGPRGTFTANVPPGSYQLIAWQQAEFPSIARTNVRTAPVTVTLGGESRYDYTGAALTFAGSTGGIARVTSDTSAAAVLTQELQTLASLHASADTMFLLF